MSGASRLLTFGKCLGHLAVSHGVADGCVAGKYGVVDAAFIRPADQCPFDAAMLKAQRDFQEKDFLAMTLKPEMPRLDDARMNRTDGDLMHFASFHAVEIRDAGKDFIGSGSIPGIVILPVRPVKSHGFEPRMTERHDPELLGDLR